MSPDSSLSDSLRRLQGVVDRLNAETETLNRTIEGFETTLAAMSPGITIWTSPLIRFDPSTNQGSQLGFMRWRDGWHLAIRRGRFLSGPDKPDPMDDDLEYVRLLEASREERAAAVPLFPRLVADLTKETVERIAILQDVNKKKAW